MEITLVILAAGMASRYGSMKQTEGFGPHGESIMDYSIYDAIRSGFTKVVFIIRKDFADAFRAVYDERLKGRVKVEYVYQDLNAFVPSGAVPEGRVKPWGTGHAILCAGDTVKEPFAVINADDFYGRDGFEKAAAFLKQGCNEHTYAIIGYRLGNTLSDHGSVSRGVCSVNSKNELLAIKECTSISRKGSKVVYEEEGKTVEIAEDSGVSMNFWCFHPAVFPLAGDLFNHFLQEQGRELKSEFFIPIIADDFIKSRGGVIQIIPTSGQWFGVTYKEDAPAVKESLGSLLAAKEYPESLWS